MSPLHKGCATSLVTTAAFLFACYVIACLLTGARL